MIIWIIICTRTRRKKRLLSSEHKYIYSRHVYFIAKIVSSVYKRGREGRGERLEFNGCRVARNLENINAFPWPYTSLIPGLLYPTGVIVMEVFQLGANLIFQAGADGALWIFYRPPPATFSAARDPSLIPIGADQIMHNNLQTSPLPLLSCFDLRHGGLNWYFAAVNRQTKFRVHPYSNPKRDFSIILRYASSSVNDIPRTGPV